MKTIKSIFLMALMVVVAVSCKKDAGGPLGGTVTPVGEVGNTFNLYPMGSMPGVSDITGEISELNNGISKIDFSMTLTNSKLKPLVNALVSTFPSILSYEDDVFTGFLEAKFTTEGVALMIGKNEMIGVKYDAKVGDAYTTKIGNTVIRNEVVSKSTEDDFMWAGGFMIKVIKVEGTGYNLPGLDRIVYYFNHRFGIVGVDFKFLDSTQASIDIVSSADNF
jgi:hypothetical protein